MAARTFSEMMPEEQVLVSAVRKLLVEDPGGWYYNYDGESLHHGTEKIIIGLNCMERGSIKIGFRHANIVIKDIEPLAEIDSVLTPLRCKARRKIREQYTAALMDEIRRLGLEGKLV